jgi:Curli production assembly/transport component CsgG
MVASLLCSCAEQKGGKMKMIRSVLIAVLLSVSSNAQHQGQPIRVVVLPFVDLLGKPGSQAATFTDLLLSRLAREDELLVKIAVPDKPGAVIDREIALNLGRKQGARLLLLGRIEAVETRQSRNGLPVPELGRVNSHSATAKVAAEVDVISLSSGKTLETIRSVGKKTARANQTWINSRAGVIHLGGNGSPTSPLGQAMSQCADRLAQEIVHVARKAP